MVYHLVEFGFLNRKYLEVSVWSFNVYELHTFLGQINIYLSESLIYDEEEHWFQLGDRWNKIRLEQFIQWPTTIDKETSEIPAKQYQSSERPGGKVKSASVRWSSRLSTFKQLLGAGDQEHNQRSERSRRRASVTSVFQQPQADDGQTGKRAKNLSVINHQTNLPMSTNTSATLNKLRTSLMFHAN